MKTSSTYTLAMPKVKETDNCQRKAVFVGVCACACGCTFMHMCKCVPVCVYVLGRRGCELATALQLVSKR